MKSSSFETGALAMLFVIMAVAIFVVCSQNKPTEQNSELNSVPDISSINNEINSEANNQDTTGLPVIASGYPEQWRDAIYREICYALSSTCYNQGRWGQSTRTVNWYGTWFAGDWNYCGLGIGIGGECKAFANTIVERATGNRYHLPSGYDYATGDIGWCRPGDIIQRPTRYGVPHTAIVFAVLARDQNGRATLIDVIDANFVGGRGSQLIARHKLPMTSYPLSQFRVWTP